MFKALLTVTIILSIIGCSSPVSYQEPETTDNTTRTTKDTVTTTVIVPVNNPPKIQMYNPEKWNVIIAIGTFNSSNSTFTSQYDYSGYGLSESRSISAGYYDVAYKGCDVNGNWGVWNITQNRYYLKSNNSYTFMFKNSGGKVNTGIITVVVQ